MDEPEAGGLVLRMVEARVRVHNQIFDGCEPAMTLQDCETTFAAFNALVTTLTRDQLLEVIEDLSDVTWDLGATWAIEADRADSVLEVIRHGRARGW